MKFSIIVPAYNEEILVGDAIKSLIANQKFIPREDFEIIVVDNNSTDKTSQKALKAGANKVVLEKEKGTNRARHRGFLESRGDIISFLDADCVAPEEWIFQIEKNLVSKDFVAVSGPAEYELKKFEKLASDLWQKKLFPKVPKLIEFFSGEKAGVILNGNWATKRNVIEEIGGLPFIAFEGDDALITKLISRKSGSILFDPKLSVKSSNRRFKKEGLIKTTFIYSVNYLSVYLKGKPIIVGKQKDIR